MTGAYQKDHVVPVWADGEYIGRTPVTVKVMPGALSVVVPE